MGAVMEGLGPRRAEMISMDELAGYMKMEFSVPARGLLGFRNELLTTTKGTGIMYHVFQDIHLIRAKSRDVHGDP